MQNARPGSASGRREGPNSGGSLKRAVIEGGERQRPTSANRNTNNSNVPSWQQRQGRTWEQISQGRSNPPARAANRPAASHPTPYTPPPGYQGQKMGPAAPRHGDEWTTVAAKRGPSQDVRVKDAARRKEEQERAFRPRFQPRETHATQASQSPYPRASQDGLPRPISSAAGSTPPTVSLRPIAGKKPAVEKKPSGVKAAQQGAQKPPAWLLANDAEARRSAWVPSLGSWIAWCDFEEKHPDDDFSYDHLPHWFQMDLAAIWVANGTLKRWRAGGAELRPEFAALLA